MLIIILIFLIIEVLLTGIIAYFSFKRLPKETQKEVLRKIEPINSEIKKWRSPQEEEEEYHKKLLENIKNE